jgi:hypothetical protein
LAAGGGAIFPSDWPTHCPPPDAPEAEGEVFRIVSTNPPTAGDFRSYFDLGLRPRADACRRRGLSLLRDLDEAIRSARLYPGLGNFIASAHLHP